MTVLQSVPSVAGSEFGSARKRHWFASLLRIQRHEPSEHARKTLARSRSGRRDPRLARARAARSRARQAQRRIPSSSGRPAWQCLAARMALPNMPPFRLAMRDCAARLAAWRRGGHRQAEKTRALSALSGDAFGATCEVVLGHLQHRLSIERKRLPRVPQLVGTRGWFWRWFGSTMRRWCGAAGECVGTNRVA
jgi:hypothetical protein